MTAEQNAPIPTEAADDEAATAGLLGGRGVQIAYVFSENGLGFPVEIAATRLRFLAPRSYPMARNWLHRFGSKQVKAAGSRPRSSERRRRLVFRDLMVQALEDRTLLAVSASVNSSVLDVTLSAANDSATISFDGTNVDVSGTGLSVTTV